MKIDLIAGARPNFVKISALINANKLLNNKVKFRIIHTGQHYDHNLSTSFFDQLEIPRPHINLKVGSGSQAEQTAGIMVGYERVLTNSKPNLCMVVGDVTSSMACAITAKKMGVKVAHIEAGIRSYDWTMPEEVNRVLIDSISDFFFTTTIMASNNLMEAGMSKEKVFFVGNVMIDTLLHYRSRFQKPKLWDELGLKEQDYLVVTIHRPGNLNEPKQLKETIKQIIRHSRNVPIIFPAHPRTKKVLEDLKITADNFHIVEPLGYLEFNFLVERARGIITDSGGISEETTVLGVPCMTLRENTERPETIDQGTNELLGKGFNKLAPALEKLFQDEWKKGAIPELWDGKAGERIIKHLENLKFSLKHKNWS